MSATPSDAEQQVAAMLEAIRDATLAEPHPWSKDSGRNAFIEALDSDVPPGMARDLVHWISKHYVPPLEPSDTVMLAVYTLASATQVERVRRRRRAYKRPKHPERSPRAPRETLVMALVEVARDAPEELARAGFLPEGESDGKRVLEHVFEHAMRCDEELRTLLESKAGGERARTFFVLRGGLLAEDGYSDWPGMWEAFSVAARSVHRGLGLPRQTDEELRGLGLEFFSDQCSGVHRFRRESIEPGPGGALGFNPDILKGRLRTFLGQRAGSKLPAARDVEHLAAPTASISPDRLAELQAALEKLDGFDLLDDLEQEVVFLSLEHGFVDPKRWPSREHFRRLKDAEFPFGRTYLRKIVARIFEKVPALASA